jgi:CHAT domain-containing protein
MARNYDDQSSIQRYLLRQLTDDEQLQIEQRLITDDELFDQLQVAEDELIDRYLAGALGKDDAEMFERHFLATPERQQKLRFAKVFRRYVTTHPSEPLQKSPDQTQRITAQLRTLWGWPQFFSASPLRAAAFAVMILVAGLGVWRIFLYQSDVNKGLLALNSAYREQRPVEARITRLNYAPFVTTRGGEPTVNSQERDYAQSYLRDAVRDHPGATADHAMGMYYLANREFDKAIAWFEKALKADPNNAEIQSDLGAVWLEKGRGDSEKAKSDPTGPVAGKSLEELGRSLEYLNNALQRNDDLLEAHFNRALVYEYMLLPKQATEAWKGYLLRDSNSQWAQEARQHLERLEEQTNKGSQSSEEIPRNFLTAYRHKDDDTAWLIISQHRDLTGGPVANGLIDQYLELSATGQQGQALEKLDALSYVGQLEEERAGDLYITDLLRFLRSLPPAQRNLLMEARRLMKWGRDRIFGSQPEDAAAYYTRAKEVLKQIGDESETVYVDYPLGHAYLALSKSRLSRSVFEKVVAQSETRQYKWLMAQALNAMANVEIGLRNHSTALDASTRSLKLSEQIGDTTGVIKTTNQLAQEYFYLGNYPKSLELHQRSLELAETHDTEPIQVWRNYFSVPRTLSAMGLHSAAIEYEKEALRSAEHLEMPQTVCRSYAILGLMYSAQGNYPEALRNIESSVDRAKGLPSEAIRKESIAYAALQSGFINRQAGDSRRAILDYDRAIQLYGELEDFEPFSYVAHKGKLLSCMTLEGCVSIEEEIRICLDLFEEFRYKILEQSNRDSFFDTEQNIYDVAIEYEFSRDNFQTAFDYSERARGRSLLDLANDRGKLIGDRKQPDLRLDASNEPGSLQQIRAALPREAQVLQYAMLEDKLLIWLNSDSDFVHVEKLISFSNLDAKLRRYLKLISSPSEDNLEALTREGMALYEILLQPVEQSLRKDKLLCIVPDKTLSYLPFAALRSGESGRYLVNDYEVIYAPSSTMFIRSSELAKAKKGTSEILLGVGNPSFSHAQFPLTNLPSAAKEVELIKDYYAPSSRTLIGTHATKRMVLAEMERSDVLHFAVHSIVDETSPMRSKLLLASSAGRDAENAEALEAYEIYGLRLPNTRLVVLSACETGIGRYYRGEGVMGLSRTFIAANVPLVIASLWRVDSDATADLMIAFHKIRKTENLSSTKALQKAQQNMANGPDPHYRHPYYWAAFTPVGGYARF